MISLITDVLFFIVLIICVIVKIKNKGMVDKKEWIEKYGNVIFGIIFLIACIILTYKIGKVPQGLHVDEAGALYDAICLSKYGVDRYLYKLPVYFVNFGGGQNALYTYLAAICIKLFGISNVVFRIPAMVLSLLSVVCFYRVVKQNKNKKEALFCVFVLVISPWFMMKSRWGLESYLMCSVLTISLFWFIKALNSQRIYLYILAGIFWGITLYTYAIAYLVVPLVIGIVLGYCLLVKKIKLKQIIVMAIPLGILAVPLILMLAMNSGIVENIKIPIFSIPKLWSYRGGEISSSNIPENITKIFEVLFIKDFLNYNAISEFGTLYKMSIPVVIFGLIEVMQNVIKEVKQKKFSLDFVMLVTFIVVFLVGLCIADLNINKINAIYVPMVYLAGRFLTCIWQNMKYVCIVVVMAYCLEFGMFVYHYFTEFEKADLIYFEDEILEAFQKAEELQKDRIFVENCVNQTYIYALVATPISPYEFNENLQIENGVVTEYGKYKFEIPQEIEEQAVYVIKNNVEKIDELLNNGFKIEKFGDFSVLWN